MIGTIDVHNRDVTVVGAGMAGMLAAYALDRKGYEVTLIEAASRAGGLIHTDKTQWGMVEKAAHSILATPAVTALCEDLKVETAEVQRRSRAKYILREGRLRRFPLSVLETLGVLRRACWVRGDATGDPTPKNITLEQWALRHLGSSAVDYLLNPFVRGIYGVEPDEIGVESAFPALMVPAGKSLIGNMLGKRREKQPRKMIAPLQGMGDLVEKLEKRLELRLGSRFVKSRNIVELPEASNIVLSVPAYTAAGILAYRDPELALSLQNIKYTPLISVTAFVQRAPRNHKIRGVGVLVPAREDRDCLGILFNSSSFPGRVVDEKHIDSFTMMLGGSQRTELLNASDQEIQEIVTREFHRVLNFQGSFDKLVINRWPRAIPQYSTSLPEVWKLAREGWCAKTGHVLFGNYTGQVSLRGMIETAEKL